MEDFYKIAIFLLIYFVQHGIFAQASTSTDGAKIVKKPNCAEKLCIAKCCPENQLYRYSVIKTSQSPCPKKQLASTLNDTKQTNVSSPFSCNEETLKNKKRKKIRCVAYDKDFSLLPEVPVYNKDLYNTDKKVNKHFNLVGPDVMNIMNISQGVPANLKLYNVYILEDSTLVLEVSNRAPWERWKYYNKSMYCVDHIISPKTGKITVRYLLIPPKHEDRKDTRNYHLSAAMLISCVFLSLVLVVYGLLPELRNLRGLVLMSYVASLLTGFLLLAVLNILTNLEKSPTSVCKSFSFVIYFGIISSFFWMHVMSLDIWWTFRGFAKIRLIHRRGEFFKYLVYCSYAWGVPLLMTAALIVLNETDMRATPWFTTPQIGSTGCFISDNSRLLYLYVPMMIILAMNCVFFVMTVFNMWRLSRGNEVLTRAAAAAGTRAAHISNRNRFMLYLKLSAVMGVNWVLEVVSSVKPNWYIWYITDVYNLVTGIVIFFIFVCKKKIWHMLLKRYSRQNGTDRTHWLGRFTTTQELPTSVTTDSEASLETLPHSVSYRASGDGRC